MLPIRWDYLPYSFNKKNGKQAHSFDVRTDLEAFQRLIQNTCWRRKFYTINNDVKRYNEMTYFHAFTTTTLFDLQQYHEKNESEIDKNKVMIYYEIPIDTASESYYEITTKTKTYKLKLTDLNLHVYATGIAILVIGCENYLYHSKDDILIINDYGRRIYPQFLTDNGGQMTDYVKGEFLPSRIKLYTPNVNKSIPNEEDFSNYDTLMNKEVHLNKGFGYKFNQVIVFPAFIHKLFDDNFVFDAQSEDKNKIRLNIVGDDRMFFQSWYGCASKSYGYRLFNKKTNSYGYEKDPYLYAFIYGDSKGGIKDITQQNSKLLASDIEESTFVRWINNGTIFGFSRDSFVLLTDEEWFSKNVLTTHITTFYYQMAVLSLAQRASILRFSSEVSNLADLGKTDEDKATKLIEKLYLNYIEFINKIYYREVSPAIQGIEIYEKFQKAMRIEKDAKSLEDEIRELYNFAMMVKQDKLTTLATLFLPFSIVFGILGANFYKKDSFEFKTFLPDQDVIIWLSIGMILSIFSIFGIKIKFYEHTY